MRSAIVLLLLFGIMLAQESAERTVQLRNGDKVSGTVVSDNDSSLVLKTSFGEVIIQKSNIKPQSITLYLKDGSVISGDIISNTIAGFTLQTSFGIVTIDKLNVDRTSETGTPIPGNPTQEEFYYGKERLVDIFFDPTGHTMEKGSIYFSGLSWGVAITDDIDISSSYWRYFLNDLNVRPKFRIFKGGSIESERSFSAGFHFHTSGATGKMKMVETQVPVFIGPGMSQTTRSWENVGNADDAFLWTEIFTAYTISNLKDDKQGRISYHAGASVILHRQETMPRVWLALDNDITSSFKVIGQVYYDPYQPSFREMMNDKPKNNPFDFDFGFVYAINENLRFGIHYQPYIILFYWKF
jgi:hypothetical protein